jgi:alkanesulfonate monooxygenase SsuD/methylene tetrahydromethanopterin reductase-like flavin-dependent oxidoreductase (luciferase family)
MQLSVLYPLQPSDPRQVAPFATLAGRFARTRLWTGQSLRIDAYAMFAHLAGMGLRVPLGVSVGLMPLRHPLEAAIQARSLAALTGRPLVAGFGVGTPRFVEALRGAPYESPAKAAAEYATSVRSALTGGRGGLPPLPTAPVEVGLGVLRPRMARLAAGAADAVITWLTPHQYLREQIVPALDGGTPAGANRPRIVAIVPMALSAAGRDVVRLAEMGSAHHLGAPHYADMLARAGVHYPAGDTAAGARAIVEAGAFLTGTAEDVVAALAGYRDCGVDEVVLGTAGLMAQDGPAAAIRELEAVLSAATAADIVSGAA